MIRSLLNAGLVEEVPAPIDDAAHTWCAGEDGASLMLRATSAGLARVGAGEVTQAAPVTEMTVAAEAALDGEVATGTAVDAQSRRRPSQ